MRICRMGRVVMLWRRRWCSGCDITCIYEEVWLGVNGPIMFLSMKLAV